MKTLFVATMRLLRSGRACRQFLAVCLLAFCTIQAQSVELSTAQLQALQNLSADELQQLASARAGKAQTTVIDRPIIEAVPATPRQASATPKPVSDKAGIKPFGYDLFSGQPSTFAPATYIPIPTDYVIGPNDTIKIQLFGNKNADYQLTVSREGTIAFPELGPVSVSGMTFDELQQLIDQRIGEQFIGVKAAVTMGNLRSIHVFVLGDVNYPGSYTVSALSTMTNALFVSGGVNQIGSLRNIELKRKGKIVTTLDLYDLLLKGDTSADSRLQPGDVIFVPPAQQTVSVTGPVRRPAIYEIKKEFSLVQLIELAGGLSALAYPQEVRLERITDNHQRQLLNINLTSDQGRNAVVKGGDLVRIFSVLEKVDNIVLLSGHVFRPTTSEWREGMRLTDLIPSTDELKPNADLDYALIIRRTPPQYNISVVSANLSAALADPTSTANIALQPKDQVVVFSSDEERQETLTPFLKQIRQQSRYGHPALLVAINGEVRFPGNYPLTENMHVDDLIRAAGGLKESAYIAEADMTRQRVTAQLQHTTEHKRIDLGALLKQDQSANILLQAHDHITIKTIPKWGSLGMATIEGEVRFPGNYPILEGETLADLIKRAGGLTDDAFIDGAAFLREELRQREQKQLDSMAENLETELASLTLEKTESGIEQQQSLSFAKNLVAQLRATKAVGRLVVDMNNIIKEKSESDIPLRNGDRILIPARMYEVTVLGEVFSPTSHLHEKSLGKKDYIHLSGGFTARADEDKTYIVRANGAVVSAKSRSGKQVFAGDTIVIPMDVDRVSKLKLWTDVTQVLYQLSLTAASLKTVGLF